MNFSFSIEDVERNHQDLRSNSFPTSSRSPETNRKAPVNGLSKVNDSKNIEYIGISRQNQKSTKFDIAKLAQSRPKAKSNVAHETYFLTACTMVKNEAPYIVEWIEYNRMQGVDRIIIYDDHSLDKIRRLVGFYHQQDADFQIQVLKTRFLPNLGGSFQRKNFQHCLDTYGNSTEWMLIADVDEFLYSPAFGTLESMLRNLSAVERERGLHFSHVTSVNLNFGSSGQQHRFENALVRAGGGRIAYRNPCGLQLITDHIRRGPAPSIFGEEREYQVAAIADGSYTDDIVESRGSNRPCGTSRPLRSAH